MPIEKLRPSFSFDEERIKQLKQIAPEAFADNQINWEVLKEALGNYLEEDEGDVEHFGLFWPGKREARRIASIPSKGTLVPCPGEGIDEENTRNIFIEGENLEVLKILQKSYAGRIKMIYIDPPYNTGNDFIYDDNFTEPLEEYLRRIGQIDEEGKPLTTNKKSDGRFHSKWLSMMYPRLKLARNLLRDDGVIFISIDDNEAYHLRSIMDELFGPENFIGVIKRRAARKTAHLSKTMSDMCDYIVIYSKLYLDEPLSVEKASDLTRPVFNAGNKVTSRLIPKGTIAKCKNGKYVKGKYAARSLEFKLMSDLEIENNKTKNEVEVFGPWRVNQELLNQTVYVTQNFGFRRFVTEEELETAKAMNDLLDDSQYYNELGSEDLEELFGIKNLFNNPKPKKLIEYLIKACDSDKTLDDFIILDFFAGTGTTAHSLYEYLTEDDRKKQFLLVQMAELTDSDSVAYKNGFKNIAQITEKRIKLASKLVSKKRNSLIDFGLKKFRLNNSNLRLWKDYKGDNLEEVITLFDDVSSALVESWEEKNLITEILLIEGFPLDSKIEEIKEYKKNKVQKVTSDFCEHKLLICLDKKVHSETIKNLQLGDTDIFICLDNAITDEEKVTLADKGLIKTI